MKKLITMIAMSLFVGGVAIAHGFGDRGGAGYDKDVWKQMNKWHDVMHGISVDSEAINNGVKLKINAESDAVLKLLTNELNFNQETLASFFKGAKAQVKKEDKGLAVSVTSDDKDTVKKIQRRKENLVYQFLRYQIHNQFDSGMGFHGHMGDRDGWSHGSGHGMMGDCYGRGNNGAMMDWDEERPNGYFGGHMM